MRGRDGGPERGEYAPFERWLSYRYLQAVQKAQLEMTIHSTPLHHENRDRVAIGDANDLAGEGFGLSGEREKENEKE
jgi:hypothetical protein